MDLISDLALIVMIVGAFWFSDKILREDEKEVADFEAAMRKIRSSPRIYD